MKVLGAVFFFCVTGGIVNFFVTFFMLMLFGPGGLFNGGQFGSWQHDWRLWPGLILGFGLGLGTALDVFHGVEGESNPRPTKRRGLDDSDGDGDSDGGSDGGDGGD